MSPKLFRTVHTFPAIGTVSDKDKEKEDEVTVVVKGCLAVVEHYMQPGCRKQMKNIKRSNQKQVVAG